MPSRQSETIKKIPGAMKNIVSRGFSHEKVERNTYKTLLVKSGAFVKETGIIEVLPLHRVRLPVQQVSERRLFLSGTLLSFIIWGRTLDAFYGVNR